MDAQSGWLPDDEYPEVAQSGWPPDDEYLEEAGSPIVDLADVVAQLQKEVEEFWAESGYGSASRLVIPTPAGKSSWDQCWQVFAAIVLFEWVGRWDGVTAALQLVSYLEGDALNVALLVPAPQRVLSGVLLDALTEHHSSPGRLADYRCQFQRVSRSPGDDPSVFAIELETLAMRAFADLNASAYLQLVRDRFIAGQMECSLRRHLDSVGPGTPIRDIVDQWRVWESHVEDTDSWGACPSPERPRPVYRVDDTQTERKPEVSLEDQYMLGLLIQQLSLMPTVSPPRATPIPSDRELLMSCPG